MRKKRLLIVLFTCIITLSAIVSCTYDYFEDETNYLVFVPEVLDNSIRNCRVMVYDAAGTLMKERYAAQPWGDNPRIKDGLFGFRLPAGEYKVYCYTDIDSITFSDVEKLETSHFSLKEKEGESNAYIQPSNVFFQTFKASITHPGILVTDTADIARYIGNIQVRFKDLPLSASDISRIAKISLQAKDAATTQYLKEDTLTSRKSDYDLMFAENQLLSPATPAMVETKHPFLPTVDDNKIMQFVYSFLDSSGAVISSLKVELSDRATGTIPLRLYHGQDMILLVDTYLLTSTGLIGWADTIQDGGDTNLE